MTCRAGSAGKGKATRQGGASGDCSTQVALHRQVHRLRLELKPDRRAVPLRLCWCCAHLRPDLHSAWRRYWRCFMQARPCRACLASSPTPALARNARGHVEGSNPSCNMQDGAPAEHDVTGNQVIARLAVFLQQQRLVGRLRQQLPVTWITHWLRGLQGRLEVIETDLTVVSFALSQRQTRQSVWQGSLPKEQCRKRRKRFPLRRIWSLDPVASRTNAVSAYRCSWR